MNSPKLERHSPRLIAALVDRLSVQLSLRAEVEWQLSLTELLAAVGEKAARLRAARDGRTADLDVGTRPEQTELIARIDVRQVDAVLDEVRDVRHRGDDA